MLYDPKKWAMPEVPVVRESKLVEALKVAGAMVEDRWCPKGGTDDKGGVCAIVALGAAAGAYTSLFEEARQYLRRAIPLPNTCSIPEWHDADDRTQAEVVAAFGRAIAMARASD
jgi:hypothetical protein